MTMCVLQVSSNWSAMTYSLSIVLSAQGFMASATKNHEMYAEVVNTKTTVSHECSLVQTSLHEKEGESYEIWEILDLHGIDDESDDSINGNPYPK